MSEHLAIRHARNEEAETLAILAARTFRDAFAADNTPTDMERYLQGAFSIEQVQTELIDINNTFLLAFIDGAAEPSGYAKLRVGKSDANVRGPDPIEIERLYVDQAVIGKGVGAGLMRACLDEAIAKGYCTVWLGVWEQNLQAIRFYERWGFEKVGNHIFMLGTDQQRDLIMQRSVH